MVFSLEKNSILLLQWNGRGTGNPENLDVVLYVYQERVVRFQLSVSEERKRVFELLFCHCVRESI